MIELFTNIPEEVKKQHEMAINLIFTTLKPFQINTFLKSYINTTQNEEEKDFINFLVNLKMEKYNNENSLACVITLAYLSARSKYKIIREMPSGVGYADFIFYPNDKTQPAFILELKKNSTPEQALKQIRDRRYDRTLKDYTGKKFAVGIGYDKKLKKHRVKFEDL